ncbi:MAG: hypothetical protein ACHWZW_18700 [Spirulina sp.]
MENIKLNLEEQELLTSVENDEWLSVANLDKEIRRYQSYAQVQTEEIQETNGEIPVRDL